ncbi:MAG TPA: serine acetyltransferase [Clostridia bacterium]|nr:serine acetyltransferase [Clostridia bacterium]
MGKKSNKLGEWINNELPVIASELETLNDDYYLRENTISLAGKERVKNILFLLRSALFPGVYEKCSISKANVDMLIGNNIREAALELREVVERVFSYKCDKDCDHCEIDPDAIIITFLEKMPDIRRMLQTDIHAAYVGDPAAQSFEEILLSYPSLEMMSIHRIAHELYKLKVPLIPRMMNEYGHRVTGIDIHPGASIGEHFFMDHGTGIVIGETAEIGNNVKIYQGVTLGARSFELDVHGNPIKGIKRHPKIEDNVIIYSHATILGGDTVIGHDSIIGASVWLMKSVAPYSTIYYNLRSDK